MVKCYSSSMAPEIAALGRLTFPIARKMTKSICLSGFSPEGMPWSNYLMFWTLEQVPPESVS
jgi:hypothetical protein